MYYFRIIQTNASSLHEEPQQSYNMAAARRSVANVIACAGIDARYRFS